MREFVSIDLFAGAGGLSLGLEQVGFRTHLAIEADRWAAGTFKGNFPHAQVHQCEIEAISECDVARLRSLNCGLIAGGPPCQGFSHSNIVNRDPRDPRNSLFQHFLRWVEIIRPPFFLIENVAGLLTSRTECGSFVIDVIKQSVRDIGYYSDYRLLQASEFGVPQRRERLFIVGAKTEALMSAFCWPTPPIDRGQVTLWQAISDLPEFQGDYEGPPRTAYQGFMRSNWPGGAPTHHEPMRHTARVIERFQAIGFGESEGSVAEELRPLQRGKRGQGRAYGQNSRRQRPDLSCSTIVASSHTNFIHPYYDRNFTVRELMRIQSFPDDFRLVGKRAVLSKKLSLRKGLHEDVFLDQRMQVGNAVPPLLAEALGRQLMLALKGCSGMANAA